MSLIYHITTLGEWEESKKKGQHIAASYETEGFIHCSTKDQVEGVLHRYFKGSSSLVELTIDPEKLTSKLVYEPAPSTNELFPHVYGPINCDAIIAVENVKL
jgi:uncharacterized protein (DUF952 family)